MKTTKQKLFILLCLSVFILHPSLPSLCHVFSVCTSALSTSV